MWPSATGNSTEYDLVVIGGGFFGSVLALASSQRYSSVALLEREKDVLSRASYTNQARVHHGYHYPRSILTALRSRVNFSRFSTDFGDCIDRDFDCYYAVGKTMSNVTAAQFRTFCRRIGAGLASAPDRVKALFNPDLVEDVYLTQEYVFDAEKLKMRIREALERSGVALKLGCAVQRIEKHESRLGVVCGEDQETLRISAARVINCTYSHLNEIWSRSGFPLVPLSHELAELALVEVPEEFKSIGITLMDGPYYSLMPFPPRRLHTLSHVRYTPHHRWEDRPGQPYRKGDALLAAHARRTRFPHMIRDAQRYVPALKDCRYVDSMWELKTILPRSEVDDSRPILVDRGHGLENLTGIIGGKVDNVYDVIDELESLKPGSIRFAGL